MVECNYYIVKRFVVKTLGIIEVHLQLDLMCLVYTYQLMDTQNHAWNVARLIQWKTKALQHRGLSILQEVGLLLHASTVVIHCKLKTNILFFVV